MLYEVITLSEVHMRRFPHEFSGGQRQRIGIARALVLNNLAFAYSQSGDKEKALRFAERNNFV